MTNHVEGREYFRDDFIVMSWYVSADKLDDLGRPVRAGVYSAIGLKGQFAKINKEFFHAESVDPAGRCARINAFLNGLTVDQFKDFLNLNPKKKGKKK